MGRKRRNYDAAGRAERARAVRDRIVDVARAEFLAHGYTGTTIATVAERAEVSVETVYKAFRGKAGLVRSVYEKALAGRGPTAAPQRSDEMSAAATDAHVVVREWGKLAAEVSPLVAPILLLVRDAAVSDSELRAILHDADRQRLKRMRHHAARLARLGALREDVGVDMAADVMAALVAPEMYEALVLRRGWSAKRFGAFVGATMEAALLRRRRARS